MRKSQMVLIVALFLLLPCTVMAEAVSARHSVELKDSSGDVRNVGGDPGKDVVKVKITSDGKGLQVSVSLKKNIAYYLKGHKAGNLVQLYFDTDNDASTGGKPFWGDNKGFEYLVSVRTCIAYKGGGEACVGGLSLAPEGHFSSYEVETIGQGTNSAKNTHDAFWKSPRTDIKSDTVVATIPYSEIGVASGQTIRIAVREYDSTFDQKSFFPDIILILK